MNGKYGKRQKMSSNKKEKTNKNIKIKKLKKGKKYIKRFAIGLLCVIMVGIIFALVKYLPVVMEYKEEAKNIVNSAGDDVFKKSLTSIVYDDSGNVIAELTGSHDSYYLEGNQIPYLIKKAFIVSEDRQFYEHNGVDFKGVLRAGLAIIQNKGEITQGGSTITQQLARNIYLNHEVKFERKLKEMFIAWELEDKYSKDEILEFYINNIYFGNGVYGIEAASWAYFNKTVTSLSVSEMIFLCAIPNNPTLYDPTTNIENTIKRRDRVLSQMLEYDEIDNDTYIKAINEQIVLSPSEKIVNNYEETFIRYCATVELMKINGFEFKNSFESDEEETEYKEQYNLAYDTCNGLLFTGGYRIYTTIDMDIQEKLQNDIDETLKPYEEKNDEGIYAFQGSATCIDNATGYVIAAVGGRTSDYEGYTLNRAFQSFRQPGSSIKPLLVYTPSFDRGYTPNSLVIDEAIDGGPKNATGYYIGRTNIRTAVEQSINTVAWKMIEDNGISWSIEYLKQMNFKKIVKKDYVSAASIGGFTYGMSTYEMAAGYATIANDGVYRNPTCIRRITDSNDKVILDNGYNQGSMKKIYQANASRMMTNILEGVLKNGTGTKYNVENAICAGKTGTTNDTKDVWFVGYSRYYTTAVWCGYDLPKEIDKDYGRMCAGKIWQKFMTQIHEGLDMLEFNSYYDVTPTFPEYELETTEEVTEPITDILETTLDENNELENDEKPENNEKPENSEKPENGEKPENDRETTFNPDDIIDSTPSDSRPSDDSDEFTDQDNVIDSSETTLEIENITQQENETMDVLDLPDELYTDAG